MLGLALLGAVHPLLRAAPNAIDRATTSALAALASDPACQLASLSVLALRGGRPVYQAQFGQRSIAAKLPVDRDTLYRIASVSKLVTTLGVMRLVEAGTLDLNADVSGYLGFSLRNPAYADNAITLRMLMTHTASLRDAGGYSWPLATSLASVFTPVRPAMWDDHAAPGAYFSYCNLGWGIIGTIMEAATGERFDLLMQRLVLAPLGIRGGYNLATLGTSNVATLYRKRTVDTEVWDAAGPWIVQADDLATAPPLPPAGIDGYRPGGNATPFSPTGGLRISAAGLGVIMQMLMAGGRHQGQRLLQATTIDLMFSRQWTHDALNNNGDSNGGLFQAWGLGNQQFADGPGQHLIAGGGFKAVGHLGDAYGLRSLFLFERATGTGFVVLIGGTSSDPDARKGEHSPLARVEERILATLWERTRHA